VKTFVFPSNYTFSRSPQYLANFFYLSLFLLSFRVCCEDGSFEQESLLSGTGTDERAKELLVVCWDCKICFEL
jgi:hypothetical protein